MVVKYLLTCDLSVRLRDVQTLRPKRAAQLTCNAMNGSHHGGCVLLSNRPNVGGVHSRHHQRMARCRLPYVKEGYGGIVLVDDPGRRSAIDNGAEYATHAPMVLQARLTFRGTRWRQLAKARSRPLDEWTEQTCERLAASAQCRLVPSTYPHGTTTIFGRERHESDHRSRPRPASVNSLMEMPYPAG